MVPDLTMEPKRLAMQLRPSYPYNSVGSSKNLGQLQIFEPQKGGRPLHDRDGPSEYGDKVLILVNS